MTPVPPPRTGVELDRQPVAVLGLADTVAASGLVGGAIGTQAEKFRTEHAERKSGDVTATAISARP